MTSNKQITPVKILKGVLVFALGVGVYLTERSYRLKNAEARSQARRSLSSEELVQYLQKDQKVESTEVSQKLKVDKPQPKSDLSVYIMKVKPQAVLWKQKKKEREEFEEQFRSTNVTKYQYPDFVRVPLSSLGVVFYNGERFYRQGLVNPPEYQMNSTGADTRSSLNQDCIGRKQNHEPKEQDDTGIIGPNARGLQHPNPPIGCCNGVPYNSSKRCCCRRASFDKETKFCCAIDGCGDFKIMKRDDPDAIRSCQAMEGIVVQEYGYHSEIDSYPKFLSQRDPPRRG